MEDPGFEKIAEIITEPRIMGVIEKLGITITIVVGQTLLIGLVWFFFKKLNEKLKDGAGHRIKPITLRKVRILSVKQIEEIILFLLKIAKYLITAFQLFITVPIIFSFYPATEELASTIFGYILGPLRNILSATVHYIPNFITIIIILVIVRYVLRGLKFFAKQICRGKVVIPGFYADWAWPTFNILRVLLYAFTVAVVYPYLPGSDSRIFQGVSVFLGLIVSLGSSSVIGNLIAGLVITYMRPFKIGDRIKIKDLTGFVVEKSPLMIRLRNIKNEFVTFPNMTVLTSEVINYSTSESEEGLVIHTNVTMGYDVPWRDVHDILIRAAVKTSFIEEKPKPFVLQRSLDDFYVTYEINAYTKEVEKLLLIYSLLNQNIQDEFRNAGINMCSPQYIAGDLKTIAAQPDKPDTRLP